MTIKQFGHIVIYGPGAYIGQADNIERAKTAPVSKGHLGWIDDVEYFEGPDGTLYSARVDTVIDTDGYRHAAFESYPANAQAYMAVKVDFALHLC